MTKLLSAVIIVSFLLPIPAHAGLVTDFDPVEKQLLDKQRIEEEMSKEFRKSPVEPIKTAEKKPEEKSGSNWWKWTLGVLVVGGIAAAAAGGGGGGGGGGGETAPSTTSGTVSTTW